MQSLGVKISAISDLSAPLKPYAVVFVASACGLVLEIVAGRLLAPTIGASLYTWTSIIEVVLAGISVGSFVGGIVADRYPSPTTLGLVLVAGGITSLSVLPLVDFASDSFFPPAGPRPDSIRNSLLVLRAQLDPWHGDSPGRQAASPGSCRHR